MDGCIVTKKETSFIRENYIERGALYCSEKLKISQEIVKKVAKKLNLK